MMFFNDETVDINGMTIPYLDHMPRNEFVFGLSPDEDTSEMEVVYASGGAEATSEETSDSVYSTFYETKPTKFHTEKIIDHNPQSTCSPYISVVMVILFVTGILTNLVGYIKAAGNRKIDRHYHNYLHIFLTNIYLLIPIPFSIAARFHGSWEFGEISYKILSVIETSAQTILAFHLTYLMQICALEYANGREKPTVGNRKIVCYFIWLLGFAPSWPAAIYDDVMADVVKNQAMTRSDGGSVFMKVDTIVGFLIPGLIVLSLLIYAVVKNQEREYSHNRKCKENQTAIKTYLRFAGFYFGLFFAMWFPFRALRIVTSSKTETQNCEIKSDVLLCFGIAFSTIMPVANMIVTRNNKMDEKLDVNRTIEKETGETEKLTQKKQSIENNNNECV